MWITKTGEDLGASSQTGYYYLEYNADASYLLRYIDYATRQDMPLCTQPNCSHSDESCPAWFAYCGNTANVFVIGDALYIFFNGAPWEKEAYAAYGEKALPRLLRSELDGSNRQEIARLNSTDAVCSFPATDGTMLYTVVQDYNDPDGSGETVRLTIDLDTGEVARDTSIQYSGLRIVGASGRKLLLEYLRGSYMNGYSTFDVDTKELQELELPSTPVQCVCYGDVCYLLETETGTLRKCSIVTNEQTVLAEGLGAEPGVEWRMLKYATSRGCVVTFESDSGEWKTLLVDGTNGAVTEQTLRVESTDAHDKMRVLNVFAQQGEELLVSPSRDFYPVSVPANDGGVYNVDMLQYSFALISLQDFWNSNAAYQTIEKIR